jgi:ribose 5-phosphate isomerase B
MGCGAEEQVDYPDVASLVANAVASGQADRGVLICGTGIGMSITANKVPGVRAALCAEPISARMARQHNDANVLALGARTLAVDEALGIVAAFLTTPFEGGRHQRRVDKIVAVESEPAHHPEGVQ